MTGSQVSNRDKVRRFERRIVDTDRFVEELLFSGFRLGRSCATE